MKLKRGLALMTKEKRTAIARMGGLASQNRKRGHAWSPEEAKGWGAIGLEKRREKKSEASN